mmetsp:Transcript_1260/g.3361  ORF Transcript_1260/g.3361 Transcript_1260/m.3361 type:complete len:272 (-) Transcript_1260:182-997(-)|eukprot:CAMPEP_0119137252 /NCGR_PEP_ID=MMETSP1310-20130426/23243_1 /TAXON_ID=464262 /ORGANISM="Genus nov. species nov., Strain RCC2339" /LENGTH=271 /DNA_ID=CAMNT_0007128321 /DNA_START=126 /DNA_END=941 /DNA_ORIENTATION=+
MNTRQKRKEREGGGNESENDVKKKVSKSTGGEFKKVWNSVQCGTTPEISYKTPSWRSEVEAYRTCFEDDAEYSFAVFASPIEYVSKLSMFGSLKEQMANLAAVEYEEATRHLEYVEELGKALPHTDEFMFRSECDAYYTPMLLFNDGGTVDGTTWNGLSAGELASALLGSASVLRVEENMVQYGAAYEVAMTSQGISTKKDEGNAVRKVLDTFLANTERWVVDPKCNIRQVSVGMGQINPVPVFLLWRLKPLHNDIPNHFTVALRTGGVFT